LSYLYQNESVVLHYTAFGKPWTNYIDNATIEDTINLIKIARPKAHPDFYEQYIRWWYLKIDICP
jgi:lipopolysaccharide biosynthesis glycosyltransferase